MTPRHRGSRLSVPAGGNDMRSANVRVFFAIAVTAMAFSLGSAPVAQAQSMTVSAPMSGAEEVPPVNTGSFGSATVTIDRTAKKITYRINVYNLPTGLTLSHIHAGAPGANGPTIFN